MNRTFIIVAIVIVLLGGGVGAYFAFFNKPASVAVSPSGGTDFPVAGGVAQEPVTGGTTDVPVAAPGAPAPVSERLVKISAGPIVPGEVVVDSKATASSTSEVSVGYIERQSGNVYSYLVRTGTPTRTSNRTVPGIQSAAWLPDGSLAFVRYLSGTDLSTINSYALPANGSGGFFLPQNLVGLAVSSTSILTLVSGVNGSVASLARTDGSNASEIFSTPLTALFVSFAGKNRYVAYTKPSANLLGAAFFVDTAGNFSRIAGPLPGLVAKASPSGKWLLVSYTGTDGMRLNLIQTATGESLPLPVATIADKCVWLENDSAFYCGVPVEPPTGATYPDDWYQGAVSFTDRVWRIETAGRYAQLVLDFSKETGSSLDMESPAVNPAGTTLVFINKNDGSLWGYSL